MAAAPPRSPSKGGLASLKRKAGPLPVWAWGAVAVFVYLLYRYYKSSSSSSTTGQTATSGAGTYVPPFDAASGAGGGGIGSSDTPQGATTNNYYYGGGSTADGSTAAAQEAGGGTASGPAPAAPSAAPTPATSEVHTSAPTVWQAAASLITGVPATSLSTPAARTVVSTATKPVFPGNASANQAGVGYQGGPLRAGSAGPGAARAVSTFKPQRKRKRK